MSDSIQFKHKKKKNIFAYVLIKVEKNQLFFLIDEMKYNSKTEENELISNDKYDLNGFNWWIGSGWIPQE